MKRSTLILLSILMFFKTEAQTSVLNFADSLYAKGNYSKAIEQYKLYNTPKEIYNKIAKSYMAIGNYDEALKNYEAYIIENPNDALIKFDYA